MKNDNEQEDRARRGREVRDRWRTADQAARRSDAPDSSDAWDQRRDQALSESDAIRDEAPEDLETRRAADQLEREVERSRPD